MKVWFPSQGTVKYLNNGYSATDTAKVKSTHHDYQMMNNFYVPPPDQHELGNTKANFTINKKICRKQKRNTMLWLPLQLRTATENYIKTIWTRAKCLIWNFRCHLCNLMQQSLNIPTMGEGWLYHDQSHHNHSCPYHFYNNHYHPSPSYSSCCYLSS